MTATTPGETTAATTEAWQEAHAGSILPAIGRPQRKLVRGAGVRVWDEEGNEYLDLLAGIAVNALGHAHPAFVEAVSSQVATLGQVSNFFASDPQIALANKLLQVAQAPAGSSVYFANSGSEANEAALKMARRVGGGGRSTIVALEGGFHGRTMGSLALTHKPAYREPFDPGVPGVVHVPFGDVAALEAAIDDDTAALFLEPIQGEAGVRNLPAGYLTRARELTRDHGALLILDEVQTGIGRTGHWFAFQDPAIGEGVVPDIVTSAKGLGGGLPLAATITFGPEVTNLLVPGQHGSTYSGNPVMTAAGLAVLKTLESEGLLAHARETGDWLESQLYKIDGVVAVSGAGLLRSFELAEAPAKAVAEAALAAGFIVNPVTPTRIRLAPPLVVTREDLGTFLDALPDLIGGAQETTATPTTPTHSAGAPS
ncbi:acetylornithine transaminase [Brevibacterium litoralis]|uniref:acetylornithine transaminase n=1 Tax=Brevibacterium litoralis TaxID=3138935 RepID=UPI0032EBBDFF